MDTRLVAGAGGSTAVADAVASVARLVGVLAGVVSRTPAAPSPTDHVADADPLEQLSESCLEGLAALARVEAATAAAKVRLVATYAEAATIIEGPAVSAHEASAREMTVVAEVACVLTIGERAASALLGEAHALTTSLPAVLDALQTGSISWQHARVLAEEITGLSPTDASALEAHFFDPHAPNPARGAAPGELVPSRFRRKVRSWRERNYPDTLEKRHAVSVADRRMEYRPDADGMAWISLYLPGDAACAVWNKATAMARGLQGPEEPRTLSQIRADMAAGLLLGHTGQHLQKLPVPKADVLVTVPVFSLLGLTEEPAELDGYGPIPASMARRLVADGAGSFYRVLVDPRDGAPLEIGRENYRLPESMKRWLRMRDGKCTFPGCSNHTLDNEVDHLTAWQQGGTTGISNLGQACPRHHRLKHRSAWTPTEAAKNEPPGWRSPTGRYYPAEQADWVPPVIPQECLPGPPKFSTGLATFSTGPPTFSSGPPTFSPETASPFEQALLAHVAA
ncbi:HNH endonuclease signature motif containing protein [Pseudarthrobacter sulfonivorans]|uniref:HNH endonuclease signature motif containing protein n=1 Tax=Pseudarthrobacter sulfonivorans TaxID=121292 RepID=UPI002107B240|nr:HNH endonuclease signature motif containing protein [Pseudarthrobacter sulfonivorans]